MARFFLDNQELAKLTDLTDLLNGNFKTNKLFTSGDCLNAPIGFSSWAPNTKIDNAPNDTGDWFGLLKWNINGQYLYLALTNYQNTRFRLYAKWTEGPWYQLADSQNGGVARHTNPLVSMVLLPSEMEVA